ncbi:MAG TPA: protein kinase [Methylomirabilota bacterium]|nr:protein kinase [Methylomirabilota bacterium]
MWAALARTEENAQTGLELNAAAQPFGNYLLLEEIARGGMGVIYRARDERLQRIVALKMLSTARLPGEVEQRRFRAEVEAIASLDHRNIVPIYEVGEVEGRAFFTMKHYARGNLERELRAVPRTRAELEQGVGILAKVAEAVHHAHQSGILHRDIKPSNILIDDDGQPVVSDFGLAKVVERGGDLTVSGAILGTPAYCSPEQALGRNALTTATDVYSLGATLHRVLTGHAPFQGDSALEVFRQVTDADPQPVRVLNPCVDEKLQCICLTCLNKNPAQRYPSAAALADDLRRWARREPILARPSPPIEQMANWTRRHPARAALVGFATLSLTIIMAGLLLANARVRRANVTTRLNLYAADMFLAAQALERENFGLARKSLNAHFPNTGAEDLRGFEWRWLWAATEGDPHERLEGFPQAPAAVALAPDAKTLAIGGQGFLWRWTVGASNGIELLPPGEPRWLNPDAAAEVLARVAAGPTLPNQAPNPNPSPAQISQMVNPERPDTITRLSFSPDGQSVLTSTAREGRASRVWSIRDGSIQFAFPAMLSDAAFSPTAAIAAVGTCVSQQETGCVKLYDLQQRKEIWAITNTGGLVAFSSDGSVLATAGWDRYRHTGVVSFWSVLEQRLLREFTSPKLWSALALSPDGRLAAVAEAGAAEITLHSLDGNETEAPLASGARGSALAFSPNGELLASGGSDPSISIWDVKSRGLKRRLRGHTDAVTSLAFFPDGQRLASASRDGSVRIWRDLPTRPQANPAPVGAETAHLLISSNAHWWASRSTHRVPSVWPLGPERQPRVLTTRSAFARIEGFDPSGAFVALLSWAERGARIDWHSVDTGSVAHSVTMKGSMPAARLHVTDFCGAAELFALGSDDGVARVWSARTGELLKEFTLPDHIHNEPRFTNVISHVRFSPDGRLLAVTLEGYSQIAVFSILEGKLLHSRHARDLRERRDNREDPGRISFLTFSADGETLASADETEGLIRMREARSGRELPSFAGHTGRTLGIAFTPDGRTLASVGANGSVKLWNVATRREMGTLAPSGATGSIAFSADGSTLIASFSDGARIFQAPAVQPRAALQ